MYVKQTLVFKYQYDTKASSGDSSEVTTGENNTGAIAQGMRPLFVTGSNYSNESHKLSQK